MKEFHVHLDIQGKKNRRRFLNVSRVLTSMEVNHTAQFSWLKRRKLKEFERLAFDSPHCSPAYRAPPKTDLVISDRHRKYRVTNNFIHVDYGCVQSLRGTEINGIFLPILFSPVLISQRSYSEANRLAKNIDRKMAILFAGNTSANMYSKPVIRCRYKILSRYELFETLRRNLAPSEFFFPRSLDEFQQARDSGSLTRKLTWIDTNQFSIPKTDWLRTLSGTSFFLCPPGVHRPYCHNLCEAQACGAVPILEYPGYYSPRLIDGVNCVDFTDELELTRKIRDILVGDYSTRWLALSRNAVSYHRSFLSLEHAQRFIETSLGRPDRRKWIMAGA